MAVQSCEQKRVPTIVFIIAGILIRKMDNLTMCAIIAMLHRLKQAGSLRLVCFGIKQWAQSQRETNFKHR